jgi:hypothetical protein
MIVVKANVPCRLVWDLSSKTIKQTGMVGWLGFAQYLSLLLIAWIVVIDISSEYVVTLREVGI